MVVAILVSVIAVFIGFFCLKCLKMRSMELSTKAKLMLSSGILFIIAGKQKLNHYSLTKVSKTNWSFSYSFLLGYRCNYYCCCHYNNSHYNTQDPYQSLFFSGLCGITGASVYADQIVPSFMITPYNQQQGEKGGIQCGTGIGIGGNDSFASR